MSESMSTSAAGRIGKEFDNSHKRGGAFTFQLSMGTVVH